MQRCPAKIKELEKQCTEKQREIAHFIERYPTLRPEIFYTNLMGEMFINESRHDIFVDDHDSS